MMRRLLLSAGQKHRPECQQCLACLSQLQQKSDRLLRHAALVTGYDVPLLGHSVCVSTYAAAMASHSMTDSLSCSAHLVQEDLYLFLNVAGVLQLVVDCVCKVPHMLSVHWQEFHT